MSAVVNALPAAALAAEALLTAAGIATTVLEMLLIAAHGAVLASSMGDSVVATAALEIMASVGAHARATQGCFARFTVQDWAAMVAKWQPQHGMALKELI